MEIQTSENYSKQIEQLFQQPGQYYKEIQQYIDEVAAESTPLVTSKQLLQDFIQNVQKLSDLNVAEEFLKYAIDKLKQRAVFDGEIGQLRDFLSSVYEKQSRWGDAANVLAYIEPEDPALKLSDRQKLQFNIRTATLYFENEDPSQAENYVKKAAQYIANEKDKELQLQYKICYARNLDHKRRFLEAAVRYYELSQMQGIEFGGKQVDAEDLKESLRQAVNCSILAGAGPQRSRILAALYLDERTHLLQEFKMLEKMYMDRIINNEEVQQYSQLLATHQLAKQGDGTTVLDRSVTQHNILSASKLYRNIDVDQLGIFLGLGGEKAQEVAAGMIEDKRLNAAIDQANNLIHFDEGFDELSKWDQQILDICTQTNNIIDQLHSKGIEVEV